MQSRRAATGSDMSTKRDPHEQTSFQLFGNQAMAKWRSRLHHGVLAVVLMQAGSATRACTPASGYHYPLPGSTANTCTGHGVGNPRLDSRLSCWKDLRGGAKKGKGKAKKKKNVEREKIAEALHEKDAARAMGDAIRDRASLWRHSPFLDEIDTSISSVGLAMGATDQSGRVLSQGDEHDSASASGGVEADTSSVVVHYFLKSHGGAHAVQTLCSILAAVSGLGAIFLPETFTLVLLRRCMVFAMMKHLAGILAVCVLAARAIPEVGFGAARERIEDLIRDPIAQYVFYSCAILVWLPSTLVTDAPRLWWQQNAAITLALAGPILLREIVSTVFVISDIFLLWKYSNQQSENLNPLLIGLVDVCRSGVNAIMSLLVTAKTWRSADAFQRQAILARLVARTSLAFEVVVGFVLVADAGQRVARLGLSTQRPTFLSVVKSGICAHLYLNFLWVRRKKIQKLATKIRGGASGFPFYVLNIMLDPLGSMGIQQEHSGCR